MKRFGVALLALLGLALAFWALWPRGDASTDPSHASPAAGPARPGTSGRAVPDEQLPAAAITGVVVDERGAPLEAEVMLAQDAAASLASEPCDCPTCHKKLLECGCNAAAAKVALLVSRREGEWIPLESSRSSADGRFSFSPPPGRYTVLARAPAHGPAFRRAVATGDDVTLVLGPPRALVGRVFDEEARPVAGALVTAVSTLLPRFAETVADANGAFRIDDLDENPHYLAVSAPGFLPTGLPLGIFAPSTLTVVLPRPRTLEGIVRDRGAPAAGAAVTLFAEHLTVALVAGEDGTFRAEGLFPGDYSVSATLGRRAANAELQLRRPVTRVELDLERALVATGRVVDESGVPVPAAAVAATLGSRQLGKASCAEDGSFSLDGVAPGASITASAEGFEPASARVGDDEAPLELMLHRLVAVTGIVVSGEGTPVPGVQILVRGSSRGGAVSDSAGRFRAELQAPGPVTLMAHHSSHGAGELSVEAPASDVRLELSALGAVRARLVDGSGKPLPGVRGLAWLEDVRRRTETFSTDTVSGEDGVLVLAGLEAGVYRLRFLARGHQPAERGSVEVKNPGEVDLGDVTLEAGEEIAGTVLHADGTPAAGAFVHARGRGARPGEGVEAGPDGAFVLVGLKPGEYLVTAFSQKSSADVRAQTGARGLVLRLPAPARLRGRVLEENGAPLTRFFVDGAPIESPDGRFEVEVRAVRDTVLFRIGADRKLTAFRQARLGEDRVADAGDIVLESARGVEGRVVDSRGNPVGGASVGSDDAETSARDDGPGSTLSRPDGSFRLEGLAPGPATLVARRGAAVAELAVVVPADDGLRGVTLELAATGAIEGTVRGSDGAGVLAEVHTRTVSTNSDARGRYRLEGLLPGTHLVVFMLETEGFRALTRQVEVREGESVRLDVDLVGGASLTIKVNGATDGMVHLMKAGPDGEPQGDLSSLQTGQLVDGVAVFGGLQSGLYTAMFYDEGGEMSAHALANVREGAQETLVLTPRPGAMSEVLPE